MTGDLLQSFKISLSHKTTANVSMTEWQFYLETSQACHAEASLYHQCLSWLRPVCGISISLSIAVHPH